MTNPNDETSTNSDGDTGAAATTDTKTANSQAWDFDSVAIEYEKHVEPFTRTFIHAMFEPWIHDHLNQKEIPHLLDVGCGTGAASMYATEQLGCHITATDISPAMVHHTKSRYQRTNSEIDKNNNQEEEEEELIFDCHVCSGMELPHEWTNRFHYAIGNFSIIFFPDPLQGLKEVHRCLISSSGNRNGKLVFSAWGNQEETGAFQIFPDAIKMTLPEKYWEKVTPKRTVGSKETLTSLLQQAGFTDIKAVGPVARMLTVPSAEAYYDRFALTSPPVKKLVSTLEKEDSTLLKKLKEKVMGLAIERSCVGDGEGGKNKDGAIQIPSSAYFGYGTKP